MIGKKIRVLRSERGLTLAQLAGQVNISESYLSQLERDHVDPSVSVLCRLSGALRVPVAAFFDDVHEEPVVVRRAERRPAMQNAAGFSAEYLTPREGRIGARHFLLGGRKTAECPAGGRQLCLHLLRGSLRVTGERETAELKKGDSIYLSESSSFMMYNPGTSPAEGIICALKEKEEDRK